MSSPDAPYKSRLFNFVNRQYLRWGDRWGKAARNLQVAVLWGAQILVYPIYLLAQTGRLLGERLSQKIAQLTGSDDSWGEEDREALAADAPIVRSLASVVLEVKGTISSEQALQQGILQKLTAYTVTIQPLAPSPQNQALTQAASETTTALAVRGIACSLETRALVLVAAENQVLDILSLPQQQQLQQRLIWEVASFKHRQRLVATSARPLPIPSGAAQDSRVLLPARWFWAMMRWVQYSPVAIAIDLFGESALVVSPALSPPPSPQLETILDGSGWVEPIAWLDGAIARLETNPPVPPLVLAQWRESVELVVQRLRDTLSAPGQASDRPSLQALIQSAIAYFFTPQGKLSTENPESQTVLSSPTSAADPLLAGQDSSDLAAASPQQLEHSNPQIKRSGKAETLTLLYILRAAINYFFGTKQPTSLAAEEPTASPIAAQELPENVPVNLPSPAETPALQPVAEAGDAWLVWEDLYEEIAQEEEEEVPVLLPSRSEPTAAERSRFRKSSRSKRQKRRLLTSLAPPQPHSPPPGKGEESRESASLSHPGTTQPQQPPSDPNSALSAREETAIDPASEWMEIDAEATSTGYVKHPLEQILEWLDRIMLALENFLLAIWRWIYRRIP